MEQEERVGNLLHWTLEGDQNVKTQYDRKNQGTKSSVQEQTCPCLLRLLLSLLDA